VVFQTRRKKKSDKHEKYIVLSSISNHKSKVEASQHGIAQTQNPKNEWDLFPMQR
jgi:hypothetical protein